MVQFPLLTNSIDLSCSFIRRLENDWNHSDSKRIPFTVRSGSDNSRTGQNLDTADLVGIPSLTSGSRGDKVRQWFNTSAFAANVLGTLEPRASIRCAETGLWNVDLGIFKIFRSWRQRNFSSLRVFNVVCNNVKTLQPFPNPTSA